MSGVLRLLTTRTSAFASPPFPRPRLRVCSTALFSTHLSCCHWMSLRSLSARAAATSATRKKTRGRTAKSTATSSSFPSVASPSSSSRPPATFAAPTAGASPKKRKRLAEEGATEAHQEKALHNDTVMMENDARLAIRMLMMNHFSRRYHAGKESNAQLAREREDYREKHEGRERRLLMKDTNALRLLGEDGRSLGDGIVPLQPASAQNPYEEASARRRRRGTAAAAAGGGGGSVLWRTLNPVCLTASQAVAGTGEDALSEDDYVTFLASSTATSAAAAFTADGSSNGGPRSSSSSGARHELEDWESATLATLCAPNLSVYDTEHDFRVRSEDVVGQAGTPGHAIGSAATSSSSYSLDHDARKEELDADVSASTAAVLKQQFAEEEDPDYTVSLYTANSDGDAGPLQL
ncbi:putative mitochondrial hypothetical protein [Leptomonas pyrrhocoris]|uniref:Uncharacterized protein n=1 Tax=Leptomonas pyrrhocoris TaxID=157538 RepID=A0A0M9GA26_LEPPY|nr:putative mitochondrial hypothetical protein [Leptomonas pyrrhocoris]XP_015664257.1 putative mitochondrial hypothetical protein [Leptomonas pyrrhocoris]XP_015664258.1 putative mitochondrial hypothetical protein [Leptomonas pyrrhocoris]KPA85817.1 putative mitochondrial hypothetical protein [Leptomonas pyrrhocoris]KPA85818.1 putative mitochondrial hypothetical protein [Leptomonas pyrrhocoris]KPA85819.1 putative mitochondrial hypothetical protein [Leptomonas pyrrhocoris]|eukprot:XP_015664256.1 putative mitochondrial hypothetical protein [Leptomonas pyrrhocoris]